MALALLDAGVVPASLWDEVGADPVEFVEEGLSRWLDKHGRREMQAEFWLDVSITTWLDGLPQELHEQVLGEEPQAATLPPWVFVTMAPRSAGFLPIGAALERIAAYDRELAGFVYHTVRWSAGSVIRVYDHDDAEERHQWRIEMLDESDEQEKEQLAALPKLEEVWPDYVRSPKPISRRKALARARRCPDPVARRLVELAAACGLPALPAKLRAVRDLPKELDEAVQSVDWNRPLPGLLICMHERDWINECFDEEGQYAYEVTPEPYLWVPFKMHERGEIVRIAGILAHAAQRLSRVAAFMREVSARFPAAAPVELEPPTESEEPDDY